MANKYLLKPVLKTAKEAFYLEDADGNTVYEGKMTKFSLLFASPFEFINRITNRTEEHKVGKTVTLEQEGGGLLSILSKRSYFKFDGQKIWDYLHDLGVRIESNVSGEKLGMRYDVTFRGAPLATIANSSPSGKSFLTVDRYYDVTCEEKDLDLAFLVAFSIARTDQTFYS
ncbi:MAG: hypothetical protein II914_02200 [Clostridia bacterium]|nr:hypothetical protein [Clostridia bacterium]MBQ6551943.1 hypothetical protein [Lachnospiraceae bacterium]